MPVHDWTRVDAGTYHAFHTAWNVELMGALNDGLLPPGYLALAEQVASRRQTDVLTLQARSAAVSPPGALDVGAAAPAVRLRSRPVTRKKRRPVSRARHVVVRHIIGHRVVAVIEVTSPANKDRRGSVRELADKVVQMLESEIHVLLIDLLPPGRYDPEGIHGAVWSNFDTVAYQPPPGEPYTLASYRWDGSEPEAFVEPLALGQALRDMPLFLSPERYVNAPLERTYLTAYRKLPAELRAAVEGDAPPAP
jgi:hypothetical protein